MSSDDEPSNPLSQFVRPVGIPGPLDKAATYIRENLVLPFRKKDRPVYYHRQFNRVPTIDQCEIGDYLCRYEADQQFKRDKQVDNFKLKILRRRWTECNYYWGESKTEKCMKERNNYLDNSVNWFIRYGEVGTDYDVLDNYMKQKHRMIYQRRKEEAGEEFKYAQ